MLFKKKNQTQVKDERIEKETNKLMTPMFYLFSAGLLACLVVKLVLREPWYNFILEILCLVPAWGYALIKRAQSGILVMKEKDDALLSIRDAIHSKAFMISFWVIIIGEVFYMFMMTDYFSRYGIIQPDEVSWPREMTWLVVYLAIWLVPAIIVTVNTLKKGWMVWGSRKREVTGKKAFGKRVVVGSLFFGLIMGLPELIVCRDIQKVDEWIKGIAKPPKINNTTQAELIQEIKHFRLTVNGRDMVRSPFYYMSDEPWFVDCIHHKTVWWNTCADGTLTPARETNQRLYYREEQGRLIGISCEQGVIFDSMGVMARDFTNTDCFFVLDHGRTLIPQEGRMDHLLTCFDMEGNRLWTHYRDAEYLGCGGEKILLRIDAEREGSPASIVKSVDAGTGKTLGRKVLDTHMVYFHGYQDGAWWVSYFEDREDDSRSWLVKLDQDAQILGKMPIESTFLQDIAFSTDGSLAYLYFYQKKVQVIRTDTLTEAGEIKDRSLRIHCGTDRQGWAWMRCAASTMEAWDRELKTPLARHKLKGVVEGVHFDEAGNLCAAAWDKKKAILRIYKMIEK